MKQARAMAISIRVKIGQRQNSNTALAPRESLLNVSSLNPLNEKLLPTLPLIRRVSLAFIKGVPAEQHGVQYHSTGPHICRSAFIELILPHIAQHLRCCKTMHMSTQSKPKMVLKDWSSSYPAVHCDMLLHRARQQRLWLACCACQGQLTHNSALD